MQAQLSPAPASLSFSKRFQVEAVSSLFVMLGIGTLTALIFSIVNHPRLQALVHQPQLDPNTLVWTFLQNFGFLRPILIIAAGVLLIRLGLRLRTRFIGAAYWAKSVLLWLLIVIGVGTLQGFFAGYTLNPRDEVLTRLLNGVGLAFPWAGLTFILFAAYLSLNQGVQARVYRGDEHAEDQAARRAWNLLVPLLTIFLLVAISPLEQVFLSSLTNERFASSEAYEFVGLDNYAQILSVRIDRLDCQQNPDGTCMTETRNGVTSSVYPNPRGVLGDEYRQLRYRPLSIAGNTVAFDLNGVHYIVSARDVQFIEAAWTSLVYTVGAITLQLTFGMFIALVLASKIRGIGYLRLAMLVPLAVPTLIATQFWDVMLHEDATGLINSVLLSLNLIGKPQAWLRDPNLQIPSVILVIVWKETPGMALLLLPGLLSISKEVYEAAQVDGLNRVQRFLRITLPLMRPTIGVALVLRTMVTLRVFDVFDMMLGRLRLSMATYAYSVLTPGQELGYSSAISVTIFVIILAFTVIYVRAMRLDEN